MRIINLHKKLFNAIKLIVGMYIKKQKKFHEVVKMFVNLFRSYIKELLKIYILMFRYIDPGYISVIFKQRKLRAWKRDFQRGVNVLDYIDKKMIDSGMNRQSRRQFWYSFIRERRVREEIFKQISGVK